MNPRLVRWTAAVILVTGVIAVAINGGSDSRSTQVAVSAPRVKASTSTSTSVPVRSGTVTAAARTVGVGDVSSATSPSTTLGARMSQSTTTAPEPVPPPTTAPPTFEQPIAGAGETPPSTTGPARPEVGIYGDSLTVLSTDRYHEIADDEVDSQIHAFAGATLPDHSKIILSDPLDRLVIALGTNDAHRDGARPWADFFNALPATKCVVWPKPYEGSNEVRVFNAEVTAILAAHPNVHVIDWNAQAAAHPDWVGPDHVHYTDEGRIHYAELLKRAALTCP